MLLGTIGLAVLAFALVPVAFLPFRLLIALGVWLIAWFAAEYLASLYLIDHAELESVETGR